MILAPVIRPRYFDANGNPLAGGKLYTYTAGTTTPLVTYTSQTGGTPNANPIILDANGEANYWLDPSLAYKFTLKDSADVVQWTVDQISSAGLTGSPQWNANSNYQMGNIVADSVGTGLFYVSLTSNNLGNVLTDVANWRALGGEIRPRTSNWNILVTDEMIRSNSTAGALTHTLPACATTAIGKEFVIKDVGTGGFTTSVKGAGSDLVDGNNTYATALARYESLTVKNNGTSWDVLTPVLPDGAVSTSAKLASGIVTSAKLATSLNLPGDAVQENGKNVAVSNTNATKSLAIIRGIINSAGTKTGGEGFTCSRASTGVYNITWSSAFGDVPAVVGTTVLGPFTAGTTTASTTAAQISVVQNTNNAATDVDIHFIAIGQRA